MCICFSFHRLISALFYGIPGSKFSYNAIALVSGNQSTWHVQTLALQDFGLHSTGFKLPPSALPKWISNAIIRSSTVVDIIGSPDIIHDRCLIIRLSQWWMVTTATPYFHRDPQQTQTPVRSVRESAPYKRKAESKVSVQGRRFGFLWLSMWAAPPYSAPRKSQRPWSFSVEEEEN